MHSNLLLPTVVLLLALLSPTSAMAGANETDSGVRIAMPVDQTRSLPKRSLEATRRTLELRSAGSADRDVFLHPAVTALEVEKRGATRLVRCSIRLAVTRTNGNKLEARATILTATATILAVRHQQSTAATDCVLHAAGELRARSAKLLASK
jgi:hypothetical protein